MENTNKTVCRQLAALLVRHGIKRVFLSPGSRNAPIIVAIARCAELDTTVVVDERCAAFMAMGYALVSGQPVAVVCTSGTALLNYAPAVAEAFYRRVPLVVISADRPAEWIDQDDSQTLRQPGALSNYVKLSCDIPEITTPNLEWYANRLINDALISATTGRRAPVHINIQLDAPLGVIADCHDLPPRTVEVTAPQPLLSRATIDSLWSEIEGARVLVIAGFNPPDAKLSEALDSLASRPNIVVMTETVANVRSDRFISRIDTTLSVMDDEERQCLRADIVITCGGALVSRFVKDYLRRMPPREHWHVGLSHTTTDCFQCLTRRIEIAPEVFFGQLCSQEPTEPAASDYRHQWGQVYARAKASHTRYVDQAEWSDLKAFDVLSGLIPKDWNLQLSNGTPIRYAQLIGDIGVHRSDCNRGVSGIDGCTSTAIGAAMAYEGTTLLITGDMSAHYDIGALANTRLAPRLKIIVMCNGGGSIFRFITATDRLAELEHYLAVSPPLPLADLCHGYGLRYYEAHDEAQLKHVFDAFASHTDSPALLAIHTPAIESARILKSYFTRTNQ